MKKNIIIFLLLISLSNFSQKIIYVKDYNALVNDGIDDTAQINEAIEELTDGDILVFEEGIYNLISLSKYNISYIDIRNTKNITLLGAIDSNAEPATHFKRTLELFPTTARQSLLYSRNNTNLTVKNFTFDNTPHQASAGEIVAVDPAGKFLKVKIFENLPMDDNTPFTAANVWNPNTLNLKEVPSLTFTTSPANMKIDDAPNRIMKIEKSSGLDFLQYVKTGEYLSWHYGWDATSMINFREGEGLTIENIRVFNSLRSAIFIAYEKNVTVRNVKIAPKGNQLAISPRDGIHSSRIKGDYLVENLFVKGTRLDAFVARGTFADVFEITDATHLKIKTDSPLANTFRYDSEFPLEFIDKNGEKFSVKVNSVNYSHNTTGTNNGSVYEVETAVAIPEFVTISTHLIPRGFTTKSLILQNNTYENIAGSSEILYTDNAISRNNKHSKIMYPAVRMGANSSAGHAGSNYQINNSSFTDCGWVESYGQKGYIASKNNHTRFKSADLKNITIKNNTFTSNSDATNSYAIELTDVYNVEVSNNSFCGFSEPFVYSSTTTRNINQADNTYCSCSSLKQVKIKPIKDTFLKGGEFGNTNYGSFSFLETKNSTTSKFNRITYLQFDASKIIDKDVLGATLLLYIEELEGKNSSQSVKIVDDNSWDENTITFNNKPPTGTTANTFDISANTNGWISVNITTAIKNQLETNGIISLAIIQDTDSETLLKSYSKESEFYRAPILEIKFSLTDKDNDGNCDDETLSAENSEYFKGGKVNVYPNPILKNTNATLTVNSPRVSNLAYEIYGINGAKVLDRKNVDHKETYDIKTSTLFETNFLSSGIYFLKVYYNNNVEVIKIIKQ